MVEAKAPWESLLDVIVNGFLTNEDIEAVQENGETLLATLTKRAAPLVVNFAVAPQDCHGQPIEVHLDGEWGQDAQAQKDTAFFWVLAAMLRAGANPWRTYADGVGCPAQAMAKADWRGLCIACWEHPAKPEWASLSGKRGGAWPWSTGFGLNNAASFADPGCINFWARIGLPADTRNEAGAPLLNDTRNTSTLQALLDMGVDPLDVDANGVGCVEAWSATTFPSRKKVEMIQAVLPMLMRQSEHPVAIRQLQIAAKAAVLENCAPALNAWAMLTGRPAPLINEKVGLVGLAALRVLEGGTPQHASVLGMSLREAQKGRLLLGSDDIKLAWLAVAHAQNFNLVRPNKLIEGHDGWRFLRNQCLAMGEALFKPDPLLSEAHWPLNGKQNSAIIGRGWAGVVKGLMAPPGDGHVAGVILAQNPEIAARRLGDICAGREYSENTWNELEKNAEFFMKAHAGRIPEFLIDGRELGRINRYNSEPLGRVFEIFRKSRIPAILPCAISDKLLNDSLMQNSKWNSSLAWLLQSQLQTKTSYTQPGKRAPRL
jgi:hypothetical protein